MHIEKYELTKKNKYNVYLSNGEVITLDERVITDNELLLKKELNSELYDKVVNENKIYEIAYDIKSKNKKIIMLGGPSSSGKTTSTRKRFRRRC